MKFIICILFYFFGNIRSVLLCSLQNVRKNNDDMVIADSRSSVTINERMESETFWPSLKVVISTFTDIYFPSF